MTSFSENTTANALKDIDESNDNSSSKIRSGEKIYSKATMNDEFCPGSVIVVLDESISSLDGLTESKTSQLFSNTNIETVEDLTEVVRSESHKAKLKEHFAKTTFRQILQVELKQKSKQKVLDTVKQLEKLEGVMYAGPDYIATDDFEPTIESINNPLNGGKFSPAPNDPLISNQWGLNSPYGINAGAAWNITTGSKNVRVGVMDSGIAAHEDLDANVVQGRDFHNNNM